jgi:nucleoside-diphosphate kinase
MASIAERSSTIAERQGLDRSERTFIMVKPDGVQRGLIHKVMKRFETRGFKLVALKLVSPSRALVAAHYEQLKDRDFFEPMLDYMCSAPLCAMVWEGTTVVQEGRKILGATYQPEWRPGTIRGDFCIETERSVCHASDSVEAAQREIALWFPDGVVNWDMWMAQWLVQKF